MKFIMKYSWVFYLSLITVMLLNAFLNKNDDTRAVISFGLFVVVMIVYMIERKARIDQYRK